MKDLYDFAIFATLALVTGYVAWLVLFGIHMGPERVTVFEVLVTAVQQLG